MAVTRERFEQGMTYEEYKAQMTRNQERFEANERDLRLEPADLAPFEALARPLNVLVIAEDWCGDVIDNLPILGGIAERDWEAEPAGLPARSKSRSNRSVSQSGAVPLDSRSSPSSTGISMSGGVSSSARRAFRSGARASAARSQRSAPSSATRDADRAGAGGDSRATDAGAGGPASDISRRRCARCGRRE